MNGHRLVIELLDKAQNTSVKVAEKSEIKATAGTVKMADSQSIEEKPVKESQKAVTRKTATSPVEVTKVAKRDKDIVVAVDAGHGGDDPGAHGQNGTEEKKNHSCHCQKTCRFNQSTTGYEGCLGSQRRLLRGS